MLKKFFALLLVLSITLAFGMTAYAVPGDDAAKGTTPKETVSTETASGSVAADTSKDDAKADAQLAFEKLLTERVQKTDDTKPFLVTITKPNEEKDSTYEKSYVISGIATKSDVHISLFRLNKETKQYELFTNTDGKSSWDVAKGKAFSKEIILENGANNIKIVAYTASDSAALKDAELQINNFTVSLLDKSIKAIIKNTITNIKDGIVNIFGGGSKEVKP